LIYGRVRGQAIQIALALDVVDPDALSAFNHHVEGMIIVRSVLAFKLD
jgi:hypothetical protein